MRMFLTGSTGFVGQHLLSRLSGSEVVAFNREQLNLLNPTWVKDYYNYYGPFDVVAHLAAVVGGIGFNQSNPIKCLEDNLRMNLNLFAAMESNPPKKFIALGSVCAYPKFTTIPFTEDELWNGYPEETNAGYGIAKRVLLSQCQAYRQKGLNAVYLIPANMYGPNDHDDLQTSHVIPAIIRKCIEAKESGGGAMRLWGSGNATRDFLYVDDCVDAIICAIENYDSGEPVNIGTGRETSIREVAELIAAIVGISTDRIEWDTSKPDGQPRRVLGVSRATAFGFTAKTSLEEGLNKTIECYCSRLAAT